MSARIGTRLLDNYGQIWRIVSTGSVVMGQFNEPSPGYWFRDFAVLYCESGSGSDDQLQVEWLDGLRDRLEGRAGPAWRVLEEEKAGA